VGLLVRTGYVKLLAVSLAALILVAVARADIGVRLDRSSGRPGERVRATSGPLYLSLYLAPASSVPRRHSCRDGAAICEPTSLGPPNRRGWVWLGRFFPRRPSFQFRIPDSQPGVYRPVVYCAPCVPGPRGSLIAGNRFTILPA
jgi:hypothetical protein